MSRQVLFYANVNRSAQIIDPLTSLSRWYAPGAALVGGKLVITPTLGDEDVANGTMEAGDPPSGWVATNATPDGVADERTGGAGALCLSLTNTIAATGFASQNLDAAIGTWVYVSGWGKKVTNSNARLGLYNGATYDKIIVLGATASWTEAIATLRLTGATTALRLLNTTNGIGDESRYDDISVKALSLPTAVVVTRCRLPTWNMTTPLASTLTTGTQMGIMFGLDDPNLLTGGTATFGLAYYDGAGNIKIEKCAAGTYSTVATVVSAWGATKKLDCKKSDASTYQFYNSTTDFATTVGGAQTIAGLTGQWYGMWSTSGLNQFSPESNPFKMVPYAA